MCVLQGDCKDGRENGRAGESCISQHPGFQAVCLKVCVLQTAYYQYQQHYGIGVDPSSLHEYVSNLLIHDSFITTIFSQL